MEARHLGSCGKPCRFVAIYPHQEIFAKGMDGSLVGGPTTTPWQLKHSACRPAGMRIPGNSGSFSWGNVVIYLVRDITAKNIKTLGTYLP